MLLFPKRNYLLSLPLALLAALVIGVLWPTLALAQGPINVTTPTDEFDTVANGTCSLREAIRSANTNSDFGGCTREGSVTPPYTINVPAGTYVLTITGTAENSNIDGDLDILTSTTISGAGAGSTIIDGNAAERVFHMPLASTNVTLANVTITNGKAGGSSGGGVYVRAGSATLTGTQVISNSASYGGGVYVYSGSATLRMNGGGINRNSASSDNGGGVYVLAGSATLTGTQVISNSASYGGGVYVSSGSAVLSNTKVISNSASFYGGGVYVGYGSATLTGTQVISNSAANNGGGVYVYSGSAVLSNTKVISNSASYGGGVYVYSGSAVLSNTKVISNSAANNGGGVYVYSGSAVLSGTQVISNSADNGGGVYVEEGSAVLSGTNVISNSASFQGGGLYVAYGSAVLRDTNVISNSASLLGGGVYVLRGSAVLNTTGGEVRANSADYGYGGGVYVGSSSAVLSGTNVISNSAVRGGGLYVAFGSAVLSNTHIISNSASLLGGGVYVDEGSAALQSTGGEVRANSAIEGGGVYVDSGSTVLSGTHVISNSASTYGGGVSVSFGSAVLSGTHVINNSASSTGGGVYLSYTGTVNATNGCIVGNSDTAVIRSDGTLNATDNWWGAPNGPSGVGPGYGDSVGPNVAYANFKTVPPAGCSTLLPPQMAVQGNGQPVSNGSTTPLITNDTDFGHRVNGTIPVTHTFTISNSSARALNLIGTPAVTLTNETAFTITQPVSITLMLGEATTFQITFDPQFAGTFTDTVTIVNNDPDDNPYTFVIGGVASTMGVYGNGQFITNGDTTPAATDGTNFGRVNVDCSLVKQTFTIGNSAAADLTVSSVSLGGTGAGHFTVIRQPVSPIAGGSTATFDIIFDPQSADTFTDTVMIANSDSNANPYTFVISGTGISSGSSTGGGGGSGSQLIYLPLIFGGGASANGPDLVVLDVTTTGNAGMVTLCNAGSTATPDAFWVDLYFNPTPAPPPINHPWDTIATHGAAWGVETFLAPGQSLFLETGGTYYYNGSSSFPEGVNAYAYADSIDYATTYGNILEGNENNNVFGPAITTAATSPATVPAGSLRVAVGLPQR